MLNPNLQIDPIVQILQLAYRRGLALRQEQIKETAEAMNLDRNEKGTDHIGIRPEKLQAQDCQ